MKGLLGLLPLLLFSWIAGAQMEEKQDPGIHYFSVQQERQPLISAHRGGRFLPGYPENAIETFDYVSHQLPRLTIECDVNQTADSVLILMHDYTLGRTTTGRGRLDESRWETINKPNLVDDFGTPTPYRIPTLGEALKWCKGKAVLNLDVKRGVPLEKVVQAVQQYQAERSVVIITYNLRDALKVHRLNPELMISASIRNEKELQQYLESGIPADKLVAFTGVFQKATSFYQSLHQVGITTILGTMGNLDNRAMARGAQIYRQLFTEGADMLSTDRPIEAYEALQPLMQLKE